MSAITTLDIVGYRDQVLANTFFRQEQETRQLTIVFPGLGYTAAMPVLYYPGRLLLAQGADVLQVEYTYTRPDFTSLPGAERLQWIVSDVTAACDVALAQRAYEQVTLIGKSIGTLALGHLLTSDKRLSMARYIWLTPLLRNHHLRAQIMQVPHQALFVIGTADSHYDAALLAEVEQASGGESVVIEGADHSLEIAGDVLQSIRVLEHVIQAVKDFLG